MQLHAAALCFVTQRFFSFFVKRHLSWRHNNRLERVGNLSLKNPFCLVNATLFPVAWRDKNCCDGEPLIGNAKSHNRTVSYYGSWQCFLKVICCGCKIYHYRFRGTHSLLGYHEYHQIAVHSVKILNSIKQTSWYNLSSENLKLNRALSTIPFVPKHFEAKPQKPLLKSDKNFENKNLTL